MVKYHETPRAKQNRVCQVMESACLHSITMRKKSISRNIYSPNDIFYCSKTIAGIWVRCRLLECHSRYIPRMHFAWGDTLLECRLLEYTVLHIHRKNAPKQIARKEKLVRFGSPITWVFWRLWTWAEKRYIFWRLRTWAEKRYHTKNSYFREPF